MLPKTGNKYFYCFLLFFFKSLTDAWMWKLGRDPIFLFKEYLFRKFGILSLQCTLTLSDKKILRKLSLFMFRTACNTVLVKYVTASDLPKIRLPRNGSSINYGIFKQLWGPGNELEQGCCIGPPGYTAWWNWFFWNRFLGSLKG